MRARVLLPFCLVAAAASGCGGDEVNSSVGTGRDGGGADAALAASGGGPSTQPTSSTSWPDSGLGPPPTAVQCTSGVCEGSGGLEPCCTADGSCGARYLGQAGAGCVALDGEGHIDPDCPSSGDTAGCCRPNDTCGAFYTATFGCVDPQAFPDPPQEEISCTFAR